MTVVELPPRLAVIDQIKSCRGCELVEGCKAPVAFRGPAGAQVVVVGEAPGTQEDEQGRPFVGPAGQLIARLLTEAGLDPESMVFMNTVSCFPHGTPTAEHVAACGPNRLAQLDLFDPPFVLLLGKVALKAVRPELSMRHGRGRPFEMHGRVNFAAYHPAAALRNGTYETALREDLARFAALVEGGYENWTTAVPDTCAGCAVDADWWETSGLGWCPVCIPKAAAELKAAWESRAGI